MKDFEYIITIDGRGIVNVYKVNKEDVDDFVLDKAESGYLVSVVTNGVITDNNICFQIEDGKIEK